MGSERVQNFFSLQIKVFQQSLSYYPVWIGDSDRISFFGGGGGGEGAQKMLEIRVLDRMNFFRLQNKVFGPFLGVYPI